MKPTIPPFLFEWANRGLREVLSVDPDTARECGRLEGKVFCIVLTLPSMMFYLVPEPGGLRLKPEMEVEPDVTLTGSAAAFLQLTARGPSSRVLTDGKVTMQGDVQAGQALQRVLSQFDFDWEELLARRFGDLPARRLGNVLRQTARWAGESTHLSRENLADLLVEEHRLAVSTTALRRLEAQVARLRADTDRLSRRVEHLEMARGGIEPTD